MPAHVRVDRKPAAEAALWTLWRICAAWVRFTQDPTRGAHRSTQD
jgi:hypothetical protein